MTCQLNLQCSILLSTMASTVAVVACKKVCMLIILSCVAVMHTIIIGKSVSCGSKGTVRVLPYKESDPTGPRRTHKGTVDTAEKAASSGDTVSLSLME